MSASNATTTQQNQLLKARLVYDGGEAVRIPPEMGEPRADQMQGTAAERLSELAGRVCYDPGTELLTKAGWVKVSELPRGIEVATWSQSNGRMEYQEPTEYIRQRHVGRMYRVLSSKVSLFTTPNHRLFIGSCSNKTWALRSAEECYRRQYRVLRCAMYDGCEPSQIEMPGHVYTQANANRHAKEKTVTRSVSDVLIDIHQLPAWATLLGYYISEGTVNMNLGRGSAPYIAIYQREEFAAPIFEAAAECGFKASGHLDNRNGVLQIRVGGSTLARHLVVYGELARNKRLPGYVFDWPISLRESLLDALMAGDGTVSEHGTRVYNTASRLLADDVQRLILTLGRPANINHSDCETCHMYRVRETAHREASVNKHSPQDEWIEYDGDVFCVSVPNRVLVTRRDEKVVLCGNCYDSLGKGRPSFTKICNDACSVGPSDPADRVEGYHDHILAVGHGSVLEHFNFTVALRATEGDFWESLETLVNRPGFYVTFNRDEEEMRVTLNPRCIVDWGVHGEESGWVKEPLHNALGELMPGVFSGGRTVKCNLVTEPLTDEEKWVSLFMAGSRGFSHEQVRHGDFTAISQRSTRYVDESKTPWVEHPLATAYVNSRSDRETNPALRDDPEVIRHAQSQYRACVDVLESWLISRGTDKQTARKQARGAARGYLGNALYTEMIFSASVSQWKRMIRQRCSQFADAEIRAIYEQVVRELKASRYGDSFAAFELEPSPDGIGMVAVERS